MSTANQLKRNHLIHLVYFFVFVTGASGLIYQVTWQKYLGRLLGSDTFSIAVIIGTFLGGLSLGYYLIGRLSANIKNHLKFYALLEAIIGVWCFVFPGFFDLFFELTRSWSFAPPVAMIFQGVISSFLLFGVPTICMGATIPLLTRGISTTVDEATGVHASIYGINTAGAFIGTLIAGFWLLPSFGLPSTMMGAAMLNLVTGVFFFAISKTGALRKDQNQIVKTPENIHKPTEELPSSKEFDLKRLSIYGVGFLSGFSVMTMENVLFRISNLSFGSSSYSFSLVLSVFLLAIALGSYLVGKLKVINPNLLFFNQAILAVLLVALYASLDLWPYMAHLIRISFQPNDSGFALYYVACFVALLMVLLPALFFTGATLPIAFHDLKRDLENVGRHSGLLLSFNTLGSLIGSILGGVVFYYFMDNPRCFLVAVVLTSLSTVLASLHLDKRFKIAAGSMLTISIIIMATAPFFDMNRFSMGVFRIRTAQSYSYEGPSKFFEGVHSHLNVVYQNDGPACSVSVLKSKTGHAIIVNGKSDSDTYGDIFTLKLSAHLPSLFAKELNSAAVVGLGTGVTVGELAKYDNIKQIDVAEMSTEVRNALPFFSEATGSIQDDPRVHIHNGDAFRTIGRSDRKWDVIISEPSNPWVMGVDMLFTRDFYQLTKAHLNEGGMFLQWIQTYASSNEFIGMVSATLSSEFKEIYVFFGQSGDLLFLASMDKIDKSHIEKAQKLIDNNPRVGQSLAQLNIKSINGLLVRQVMSNSVIDINFSDYEIQTLDHARLHYVAGREFFRGGMIEPTSLYLSSTSYYYDEFLLLKRYPDWITRKTTQAELDELMNSTDTSLNPGKPDSLPTKSSLRLMAYLREPHLFALTEAEQKKFQIWAVHIAANGITDESALKGTPLENLSLRQRVQTILDHTKKNRKWLVPYPIDGLKKMLKEGISTSSIPEDKNWFVLNFAKIILLESKDISKVRGILSMTVKDKKHKPIMDAEGETVYKKVNRLLKILHAG